MNFNTIRLDEQVVNSLKFFYMLTIYLCSKGWHEDKASQSLREYCDQVKEHGYFTTPEIRNQYHAIAYSRIPTAFLAQHDIPGSLKDGIRVVDSRTTWIK